MNPENILPILVLIALGIGGIILLFAIFRGFIWWLFGIDRRIKLLEEISRKLR